MPAQAASNAVVEGLVTDAEDKPVPGATVYVYSPDRGPGVTSKTRTATTSSQGRYRVKTSPAGWYQVKAAVDLGGPCKIRVGAKKPVKVGSGKVKQVNLKLPDLVELRYRPVAADGYSRALPSEVCWRKQTFDGKAWVRAYVPARSSHVDITWHDVIMDHRFIEQDGRSFFVDPGRPVTRHSLPKATDGVIDLGYLWEPGTAGTATVAAKFRLEGRSSTRVALERQDSAADLWRIVTTVSDEDELTFPEVPVGRFKLVVDGQSTRYTVDVPEGGAVDLGTVDLRLTSQVRVRTSVDSKLRGEDWAVDLTAKHHFDFPGDTFDHFWGSGRGSKTVTFRGLGKGTYRVHVPQYPVQRTYSPTEATVKITGPGQRVDVTLKKIRMDKADRTIRGTVRNKSGAPRVRVAYLTVDGQRVAKATVKPNGTYVFRKATYRGGKIEFSDTFNVVGEYTATPRTVAKVSVRPSMKDTKVSTVRVR